MSLLSQLFLFATLSATPAVDEPLHGEAMTFYKRGDLAHACPLFRHLVDLDPANASAWADLGLCLHKSGAADAIEASCKAIALGDEQTRQSARFNLTKWGGHCDPSIERSTSEPQTLLMRGRQLVRSNFRAQQIELIDPATREVVQTVNFDAAGASGSKHTPGDAAVAGGQLFVVHNFTNEVMVFDLASLARVGTVRLPDAVGGTLCASPDGQRLVYASNGRPQFLLINPRTLSSKSAPYPRDTIGALACLFSLDGRTLFVATQRPKAALHLYDLDAKTVAPMTITLSNDPLAVAGTLMASPDGNILYVGLYPSTDAIVEVDLRHNRLARRISFEPREGTSRAVFAFAFVDGRLSALLKDTVTEAVTEVAVIDPLTLTILSITPVGDDGGGDLALWGATQASNSTGLTAQPDAGGR